ncbi:sensor histidine kinase [Neobacillus sp. PS3-12]|jgi:two-component system, NarL family, sensor histidine kinase DesK|uniref:sensor histidine kinase n=1 Tax=Neobacillus sp. PS3-12 TaxID=3070677 RepID=UPI0027E0114A|nr:sensor histidine kinase [Neobacillus sp. PS3-12]WML53066.1 sensor histidine kinase [Neobacillus sp. PS3-12]
MFKKYWMLLKGTGVSPYIWTVLAILPFYFISQSPSTIFIIIGVVLTLLFFLFFRFAFISKRWTIYLWTSILIGISAVSTIMFSYVYFAFFLAYLIGNIKGKITFVILYFLHLVITVAAINYKIILREPLFIKQVPFVLIIFISIILLPFSLRFRKERGQLEEKLEDANKRIAELVKQEERQRIARDLHDTLGQKLSLIGLKSDLARKLVYKDPEKAKTELKDVQQTARTALNEVRKMVADMRGIRLKDELIRVKQLLAAAQIDFICNQEFPLNNVSLLTENILSMCLKEAVTNVVKHSGATTCCVSFEQTPSETIIKVQDNGRRTNIKEEDLNKGSGLKGMRERLEFVNGSLEIITSEGTSLYIKVPNTVKLGIEEETK